LLVGGSLFWLYRLRGWVALGWLKNGFLCGLDFLCGSGLLQGLPVVMVGRCWVVLDASGGVYCVDFEFF